MTQSLRINSVLMLDDQPVQTWDEMVAAYNRRRATFGETPRTLYYSRDSLHRDRLAQVEEMLAGLVEPGDSLLDVGCGFGDLVPHLPPTLAPDRYLGLDVNPAFVATAAARHPGHRFETRNLLDLPAEAPGWDWVALVGIMGTLPDPESILDRSMALARKGLLVDFIDARKFSGPINLYDLGRAVLFLADRGGRDVRVLATPDHPWTFVLAQRAWGFAATVPA